MIGEEEGERCNRENDDGFRCDGTMIVPDVVGCSCHISPPCGACTTNPLTCDVCGAEVEVEP